MLTMYPACFYHDDDFYSVVFPDLNYLATDGKSLEEAMDHAIECLAGYVFVEKLSGHSLPEPSNPSSIDPIKIAKELDPEDDPKDCFINIVSVDVEKYAKQYFEKSVKKTLTIPLWLNQLAEENNINFSKVLKEALIRELL